MNASLAPGAAVLDENTITDAVCALHNGAANQWQRRYYYKHVAEIVPCGRLNSFTQVFVKSPLRQENSERRV